MKRIFIIILATALYYDVDATTFTIKEINNESNASLTVIVPNREPIKIPKLDTHLEPIKIYSSTAKTIETSPIIFAEGKHILFNLTFTRDQKKALSGRVTTTVKAIQDEKKVIAKKEQGYQFDQDYYEFTITIKPGKGTVIAEPKVLIEAEYNRPKLEADEDWVAIP